MGVATDSGKLVFTALTNETFTRRLTWKTGASRATAEPVDLRGCTGKMQVRDPSNANAVVLTFTTSNATMTLGGIAGTIDLLQTVAVMSTLAGKSYQADLLITLADAVTVRNLVTSIPFVAVTGVTTP